MMSKLLLVEDDQSIVSSLSDYLGNEGFKIESASGQKEAIEKLDNDQYDIALVDIHCICRFTNMFCQCFVRLTRTDIP